MSLNDPRWGRKGSEDDSSQKENEIKEPPKETDEEPRKAEPSRNEMPGRFTQNNNDGDLEELWKQFNDRLNSMLGGTKGNQNRMLRKKSRQHLLRHKIRKTKTTTSTNLRCAKTTNSKISRIRSATAAVMETAVEILSRSLRFRLHSPAEWLFQPLLSLWPRGWPPAFISFRKVRTAL